MGKASHEPASVQKNAVIAWISVTDAMITARTAAVLTGSGIRRRIAGSSTQSRPERPVPRGAGSSTSTSVSAGASLAAFVAVRVSDFVFMDRNSPPLSDIRVTARPRPLHANHGTECARTALKRPPPAPSLAPNSPP
ncbi:hypothetical protein GCM10011583_42870 [Streptomyces camponoticapitis]|uniref:Uncharacterized protein n=1 Tax=Streptomyces camponoticapitis TaxID=1616125 RepID=A0ABQ2EG43_9ACTN|nr:hypothetical protein GCM10011583_42870 [Streptomyces camponoticapitis]